MSGWLSIMLAGRGETGTSQARLRSSEKINKILNMSDTDDEELDKEAVGKKVGHIVTGWSTQVRR